MMRFGFKQEQALKLAMTPELREAIQILQYSSADLLSYLREQADGNPVIDLQEGGPPEEHAGKQPEAAAPEEWGEAAGGGTGEFYSRPNGAEPVNPLEWIANPSDTLYEHLKAQLGLVRNLSGTQRKAALYLIGSLDEKGYLMADIEEAAGRTGAGADEVLEMLELVQSFEPAGIAARGLKECILLQLRRAGAEDELAEAMTRRHLEDLAGNRLQRIADALGAGIAEVQRTADRIRRLDPCPGAAFARNEQRYITPDIIVEASNGEYLVRSNELGSPRVTINSDYRHMLRELPGQEEARQYIQDKLHTASWLIRSLEQRRATLIRVARSIVDMQRDFFDQGIQGLKPLTQKEIAEQTGLHESTISRAVGNKYMQTPRGLFELKFFFTSALSSADGEAASSESVKLRIRQIIDGEDKRKPLSDQAIAELLAKENLEISRRTVAKYREEMRVLSSAKRKRF